MIKVTKNYFVLLLISLLASLSLISCDSVKKSQGRSQTSRRDEPVFLLSLEQGLSSINNDSTPTVVLSGVSENDTLFFYSQRGCEGSANNTSEIRVSENSVKHSYSELPEGRYQFSAKLIKGSGESLCSNNVSYEIDQTSPDINLRDSIDEGNYKIWSWNCDEIHCVYRFSLTEFESNSLSEDGFSSWAKANQVRILTTSNINFLHIQSKDKAGNLSGIRTRLVKSYPPPPPDSATTTTTTSSTSSNGFSSRARNPISE